ncbi:ornithine cyclodeaminase family protein [Leisingera daeponensis]|uniref:ornithine cyclodeaminase family protein n=1 Tax=Leisingera daeponensis TaxID=405746 RepID=UPI001C93D4C2|nr:ornithine cyclodeaminase family protein [Leisingera daeponensis]MBY6058761.1 ornithine cyclodeaminase family protein [Leisingera daeponensis]
MEFFTDDDVKTALPWPRLIDELRDAFAKGVSQPLRSAHPVPVPGEPDATFLTMPAWEAGGKLAVKILFIAPGNSGRNLPAVNATVMVFDAVTGQAEAVMEGGELTARRTAATSAMAASFMARKDAKSLLIVGSGKIAGNLVPAHRAVRDYENVKIWGRNPDNAKALANRFEGVGVATDLDAAVAEADVIAAATITCDPLIKGKLLKPGSHLDLVGGYTKQMREADTDALQRAAGGIVVDTYDGAMAEAGDLTQPLEAGDISKNDIVGDLAELCRGEVTPRKSANQITLFKSVGAALEDFVAARVVASSG